MNNILKVIVMAIIGGCIGYITNKLAIKLIFRPINPIKIPILNIEILGLIPKRKKEIAKNIGDIIQREFISVDEILENIIDENDKARIVTYIKGKVRIIIEERAILIPSPIRQMLQGYIENIVEKYVDAIFNFTGNFGYTKNELLREVFMDEEILDDIIFNLEHKKNIILQGPSGVGKTFIAKRLCYFHQGSKDNSNIEMIQFHEYYSYEEFVRGYKKGLNGEDYIKNGIFYNFVKKAQNNPEQNYYFIIDEINRGNVAKVFGELMMLIENNKNRLSKICFKGYS